MTTAYPRRVIKEISDSYPAEVSKEDCVTILREYLQGYAYEDDNDAWFGKVRLLAQELGYAAKPKDFKKISCCHSNKA